MSKSRWMKITVLSVLITSSVAWSLMVDFGQNAGQANSEQVHQLEQKVQQLQEEQRQARQELKQLEGERGALQSQRSKLQKEVIGLDQRMTQTQLEIAQKQQERQVTEEAAQQKAIELKEAEKRVAEREELLKSRVRSIYESGGSVGYFEVLLGASNFGEFLERLDFLGLLVQQDQKIIEDFIAEKNMIAEKKLELDGLLVRLQGQIEELNALQNRLKAAQKEKQVQIASVEQTEAEIAEEERKMAEGANAVANQIAAAIKEIENLKFDGVFAWPVPDSHRITSYFGLRTDPFTGQSRGHNGMDIGAPQGTAIVAAADGIVILAQYLNGYGNTVIIEHGGGIRTLYGHIRNGGIKVSVGQSVSRGEKIAEIGSTGRSTGPHLHLEVHEKGKRTDPLQYLRTKNN